MDLQGLSTRFEAARAAGVTAPPPALVLDTLRWLSFQLERGGCRDGSDVASEKASPLALALLSPHVTSPAGFLARAARNALYDCKDRQGRDDRRHVELSPGGQGGKEPADGTPSVEELWSSYEEAAEIGSTIEQALAVLGPADRRMIERLYLEDPPLTLRELVEEERALHPEDGAKDVENRVYKRHERAKTRLRKAMVK